MFNAKMCYNKYKIKYSRILYGFELSKEIVSENSAIIALRSGLSFRTIIAA